MRELMNEMMTTQFRFWLQAKKGNVKEEIPRPL
jgi:hypothetical protein